MVLYFVLAVNWLFSLVVDYRKMPIFHSQQIILEWRLAKILHVHNGAVMWALERLKSPLGVGVGVGFLWWRFQVMTSSCQVIAQDHDITIPFVSVNNGCLPLSLLPHTNWFVFFLMSIVKLPRSSYISYGVLDIYIYIYIYIYMYTYSLAVYVRKYQFWLDLPFHKMILVLISHMAQYLSWNDVIVYQILHITDILLSI